MEISSTPTVSGLSAISWANKSIVSHQNTPTNTENNGNTAQSTDVETSKSSTENDSSTAKSNQNSVRKDENKYNKKSGNQQLDDADLEKIEELKKRDREVRSHEAAHLAAAGQYAQGGPTFDYQRGPDGKNYATGGEVSIDTSPVPNNPEATIRKARQIRAAAHAPAEPSGQDRRVAVQASQMEAEARAQLQEQTDETTSFHKSESTENTHTQVAQKAYRDTQASDKKSPDHLIDTIV